MQSLRADKGLRRKHLVSPLNFWRDLQARVSGLAVPRLNLIWDSTSVCRHHRRAFPPLPSLSGAQNAASCYAWLWIRLTQATVSQHAILRHPVHVEDTADELLSAHSHSRSSQAVTSRHNPSMNTVVLCAGPKARRYEAR